MGKIRPISRRSRLATITTAVATGRLLVVEDDETIRETVGDALRSEGYEVLTCGDGAKALQLLLETGIDDVDLVVLDLMLPGMGGLDLCRELRRSNNTTPILVISARDSETDRVLGLEVGADDYLVKPFGIRELVARCRALLRRARQSSGQQSSDATLTHANLNLFTTECRVTRDGLDLTLSPKEYKILELFLRNPKRETGHAEDVKRTKKHQPEASETSERRPGGSRGTQNPSPESSGDLRNRCRKPI